MNAHFKLKNTFRTMDIAQLKNKLHELSIELVKRRAQVMKLRGERQVYHKTERTIDQIRYEIALAMTILSERGQ